MTLTKGIEVEFLDKFIRGTTSKGNTRSAMSDGQIINHGGKIVSFPGGWSNGFAAFYDDKLPKLPKSFDEKVEEIENSHIVDKLTAPQSMALVPFAYPVSLYFDDETGQKIVKFSNDDQELYFDGRYVSALLKRCKGEPGFCFVQFGDTSSYVLVVSSGGLVVGMIMQMTFDEKAERELEKDATVSIHYVDETPKVEPVKVEQPRPVKVTPKPEPVTIEATPEPEPVQVEQPKPEPKKATPRPEPVKVEQPKPKRASRKPTTVHPGLPGPYMEPSPRKPKNPTGEGFRLRFHKPWPWQEQEAEAGR